MAPRPSGTLANAVAPGVRVGHIEPIRTRIARNRWRFLSFMLAFSLLTAAGVAVVLAAAYPLLVYIFIRGASTDTLVSTSTSDLVAPFWLLVGTGFAATFALTASLAFSRLIGVETKLLARLDARMPKGGTLLSTKSVLRDMAIAAGLPKTPQFYVIDTDTVNAFALGRSYASARIGVTRGLLERTTVDEQRAVFANLVARIASLDILWATAVCAVMGPLWKFREHDLRREDRALTEAMTDETHTGGSSGGEYILLFLPVWGAAIVVSELLMWYHQESLWHAAEKADAEGMMLLKDPRSMLSALVTVLERNNHVKTAGEAYSQLFYCWAGYGFAPEDDPEMRRVARLREVLGAEGAAYVPRPNVPAWPQIAPPPPRLDLLEAAEEQDDDANV